MSTTRLINDQLQVEVIITATGKKEWRNGYLEIDSRRRLPAYVVPETKGNEIVSTCLSGEIYITEGLNESDYPDTEERINFFQAEFRE